MDSERLEETLAAGLATQRELLTILRPGTDYFELQRHAAPWFSDRTSNLDATWLGQFVTEASDLTAARELLGRLKQTYWQMLDSMNTIDVKPGQVIHNATPSRHLASPQQLPSAEVHALGNPEGREILALEVRLPGPTLRAWDNVRFPQREVDVGGAISALNLKATVPDDFICTPRPVDGRPNVYCSVDSQFFRVEHLRPGPDAPIELPPMAPHCLHVLSGEVRIQGEHGRELGLLRRGDAALVPIGVGPRRIEAQDSAHLVQVLLPEA